jgi:hypothetical protein
LRKRSAVLEALERLRDVNPGFTLGQIMALLYVADEESPLPLGDLRSRLEISPNLAWRTAEALRAPDGGVSALVEAAPWGGRKAGALRLTAAGEELARLLDGVIADAQPIKEKPADPWGPAGVPSELSIAS